jgi:site-specific DNA-methyltransferase (adenine-specific)
LRKEVIGNATLYLGDCLTIRPDLVADAVITDPPYGMAWDGKVSSGPNSNSWANARSWSYGESIVGDDIEFDPSPWMQFKEAIIWGFNHFPQRLSIGTALIWIKRHDDAFGSFLSDAEIAWMKGGHGAYCYKDVGYKTTEERVHPTQKPLGLMRWCVSKTNGAVVFDPFMGSGSTGVACVQMGRKFVGIEIEQRYFDIACERIENAQRQEKLFA